MGGSYMRFKEISLSILGSAAAALFCAGVVLGEGEKPPSPPKQPNPVKALQTALKNLGKSPSYRATVSVEGGISEKEDHSITERTVSESYTGEVFGSLMHVPVVKVYRNPKKGVAYIDGSWRYTLSDPKTTRLERLFAFPEIILSRALTHAPQGGRWLTPAEEKARGIEPRAAASAKDEDEDEDAPAPKAVEKPEPKPAPGKTVAQKPRSAQPEGPAPRIIYVEAPPKEALQHFTEVQNSGCMSGG
jgi:hypothetical protein